MNLSPVIAARGLDFTYAPNSPSGVSARRVLRSLNLMVAAGEIVAITGPSGAGKTTLLALCGTLRSIQCGDLHVLGRDLSALPRGAQRELRSSIGFIFQSHHLLDALTARDNVVMSLQGCIAPDEASRRAEAALLALGLAGRVDALPERLSGGEKQRVAVARALVRRPALILADEPTASLDDISAASVKAALTDAARVDASAVVLVTHDTRLLEIAHRVLRLVDGQLTADGHGNHPTVGDDACCQ